MRWAHLKKLSPRKRLVGDLVVLATRQTSGWYWGQRRKWGRKQLVPNSNSSKVEMQMIARFELHALKRLRGVSGKTRRHF
jgi:hypothetical protein